MTKSRNFCYTLNNWNEEEYNNIITMCKQRCKYAVIGKEKGEEKETPHLQMYLEYINPITWKQAAKLIPRCHCENRKGSAGEASDYCMEDGDYITIGELKGRGHRTDIEYLHETILKGDITMRALIPDLKNLQQIKFAETLLKYYEPKRNWKTEVTWIYGKTGTGKSKMANEMLPEAYWKDNSKWWEGYDAHKFVIIDDFREAQWKFEDLLRLLDRYPYRIETKGGSRQLLCAHIIITCPFPPDQVYKNAGEDLNQLLRRIDSTIKCTDVGTEVKG